MRVVHLSSVHHRRDTRIFVKQCRSLVRAGCEVYLLVADGLGDENIDGVQVKDVGKPGSRIYRMLFSTRKICRLAISLNADICHFHDPELLTISSTLRRAGSKVIFDSHEDVPKQIANKPYMVPVFARVLSFLYAQYERYICTRLSAVVAATPFIREKFEKLVSSVIDVNNFPLLEELGAAVGEGFDPSRREGVCYVGSISPARGIKEIVAAMDLTRSCKVLRIGGNFYDPNFREEVKKSRGWKYVDELGFLTRDKIAEVFACSRAGLVVLHPISNYLDALPVKMFEYMSAGIPVICSDFPLWRDIVDQANCGICVDPMSLESIAQAMDYIEENPVEAEEMGRRGRAAVENIYNWPREERKLLELYNALVPGRLPQ